MNISALAEEKGWPEAELSRGLWPAVEEFLAEHVGDWELQRRYENNNGLTILARRIAAEGPVAVAAVAGGVGMGKAAERNVKPAAEPAAQRPAAERAAKELTADRAAKEVTAELSERRKVSEAVHSTQKASNTGLGWFGL